MTGRLKTPRFNSRYLVIHGPLKGRLIVVYGRISGGKESSSDTRYRAYLCDCWGGPTDKNVVVKLSEIEL